MLNRSHSLLLKVKLMYDVKIRALFIKWQGEKRFCHKLLQINEKDAAQYKRDKHVLNFVNPQEDTSASLSICLSSSIYIFKEQFHF